MKKRLFLGALFSFCMIVGQMACADNSKEHPRWGECFHAGCYNRHDSDRKKMLKGCNKGDQSCYEMQERILGAMSQITKNAAINATDSEEQKHNTKKAVRILKLTIEHGIDPHRSQEKVTKAIKKEIKKQEKSNPGFTKQFSYCWRSR